MKELSLSQKVRIYSQWYLRILWIFCVVTLRLCVYYVFHLKEFKKFLFSFFSILNEVYQHTHGQLRDFNETQLARNLKEQVVFAQSNSFNIDLKVMRLAETQILASFVAFLKPKTIFEIGTYSGLTTLHFAYNSPAEAKIYTLDLPFDYENNVASQANLGKYTYDDLLVASLSKQTVSNRVFKGTPFESKIKELFGDSMRFDFSPYQGKIDLVLIDGNHSHPYIQFDTQQALKMLSPNGVIVWHDYDYIHRDIFKYLNSLAKTHKIYSIPNSRFAIYGPQLS